MWGTLLTVAIGSLLSQAPGLEPLELEPLDPTQTVQPAAPALSEQPGPAVIVHKYPPGTILYVDATSLALRSGPNREALLKHYIPNDARVTTLADVMSTVEETISGKTGHWLYVQHGDHKGYVFDAYLVPAPPSIDEALDWKCIPGERVGPININTTYDDLLLTFGEPNLAEADIPVGEGKMEPGTVVFPDDDTKRLFVQWAANKTKPKLVIVEGTRWKTEKGVGIGTKLAKLTELNGGPFSFAGFGWDFAGFVTSWRGGTLESGHTLREKMTLYVAPKQPYLPSDYEALVGDVAFSSDAPEATRLNIEVSAMTVILSEL